MYKSYFNSFIVWIDGTYGVGKTAASNVLQKNYKPYDKGKFILLESDYYYRNGLKKYKYITGGVFPQNNHSFIIDFKQIIEKHASETNAVIIVTMALTMNESKDNLLNYFIEAGYKNIHIILTADQETIVSRVNNSPETRDKSLAINNIEEYTKYLIDNYPDAEWVNTDGKSPSEVAESIAHIINRYVRIVER